jgi:hypothetical protein
MDWGKKESKFDKSCLDIMKTTIELDSQFNRIIKLYFVRESKFEEFDSELLDKEFFSLSRKGQIVYLIAENILSKEYYKGLLDSIQKCLNIRNILVHTKAVEEKWTPIGYKFPKKNGTKKGEKELKNIEQIYKDFYDNFKHVLKSCYKLTMILKFRIVLEDFTQCQVEIQETMNHRIYVYAIEVKDSHGRWGHLYGEYPAKYYALGNYEAEIQQDVKRILGEHNINMQNKEYPIKINWFKILEPPEEYEDPYREF